ncbi:MAG TPA: alpha/beta hydrolase [Dehalococcoidia bacterium]|nr:alpha/beta hydrolase [Dehalococcoidia bacterium]
MPSVLIDPELAEARAGIAGALSLLNFDDLAASRAALAGAFPVLPPSEHVAAQDRMVPGPAGAPAVKVRIYRPKGIPTSTRLPGLYFMHGGGMIMGNLDADNARLSQYVEQIGCVVVSVEYRLAPENPHPAPVEDCYAGLVWTAAHAGELGIDATRLAIGGGSAGGGLAAGTALLARDRGGPALCYQMLIYPMLDDRNTTPSSYAITDVGIWDRATSLNAWQALLGDQAGTEGVSPYAAPARATDLARLPAAYLDVGTADLFRDEDIAYAQRLMQAGVPVELHVYPGAYHAFEFALSARLTQTAHTLRMAALKQALTG